jgi:DNA-binding MarR family transcriptional regulator
MADKFEKRKKEVLAPIFFEAGAALYDCQSFEYGIAYLLYLYSRLGASGLDPTRCAAILDDDEKKTAGQLIQMLRKHLRISQGLEDGLIKALEARNLLIHRYFIENGERIIEVSEHELLVKEIRALRSTVRRSQKQLHPFVRTLAKAIDGAPFDTWAAEMKEKFLRETQKH